MRTKTKKYVMLALFILAILGGFLIAAKRNSPKSVIQTPNQTATIQGAQKAGTVNREFSFPIRDANGDEISSLTYTIESSELRDEILVKGQKATAVNGRTFLVMNIKLTNPLDKAIKINTRDYVRLLRNGNPIEPLAPEIHNDPVEVQAISTKITRIGFPINKTDADLQLQVGEIKGNKEIVAIVLN